MLGLLQDFKEYVCEEWDTRRVENRVYQTEGIVIDSLEHKIQDFNELALASGNDVNRIVDWLAET